MAQTVTVFGGTGFLGREVTNRLRKAGVSLRIASRHPDRSRKLFGYDTDLLQSIGADIHELAVRDAFPEVALIRPAVMFGADDAFLRPIIDLMGRLPVFPMFGRGETRLQPAFVEDVAQAVMLVTQRPDAGGQTFECAGPRIYGYATLLRTIADAMHVRVRLMPMPFFAWRVLAGIAERLPRPVITSNQVELMQRDNVAAPESAGFAELGISPRSLEEVLPTILARHR
jgi:uncharacterized protein YbjT (DUF2867 family)